MDFAKEESGSGERAMEASRLEELLLLWEEQREHGNTVSVQQLCADAPELAEELQHRIGMLDAFALMESPATTPAAEESLPTLAGYRMLRKLGAGSMGTVYLAEDEQLRRQVAIKILQPKQEFVAGDERARFARRFEKEARTLAQLRHDSIVSIHQARLQEAVPFFVMELLPNALAQTEQRDRMRQEGPQAIAQFMAKVARAVDCAHGQGVLHRDLKRPTSWWTSMANRRCATSGWPS
jgi:serine/threonine protein kinase